MYIYLHQAEDNHFVSPCVENFIFKYFIGFFQLLIRTFPYQIQEISNQIQDFKNQNPTFSNQIQNLLIKTVEKIEKRWLIFFF